MAPYGFDDENVPFEGTPCDLKILILVKMATLVMA